MFLTDSTSFDWSGTHLDFCTLNNPSAGAYRFGELALSLRYFFFFSSYRDRNILPDGVTIVRT